MLGFLVGHILLLFAFFFTFALHSPANFLAIQANLRESDFEIFWYNNPNCEHGGRQRSIVYGRQAISHRGAFSLHIGSHIGMATHRIHRQLMTYLSFFIFRRTLLSRTHPFVFPVYLQCQTRDKATVSRCIAMPTVLVSS